MRKMDNHELLGYQGMSSVPGYYSTNGDDNRERGMARFYILLEGEITQERSEESVRRHMAPYSVEFVKTEWFSTYNGLFDLYNEELFTHTI